MAYSGTHETTKFGERDSGNALLVEIAGRGSAPVIESIPTGGLHWKVIEESLTDVGDAARVREQVESLPDASKSLVDLRISGILHHEDQPELQRIEELVVARFLYGRLDTSNLTPSPSDGSWLDEIPGGVMQSVARRLQELTDPSTIDRPDGAPPETATRALLELYRLVQEGKA